MADLEELLREASGPNQHRVDVDDVVARSRSIRRNRTVARTGGMLAGISIILIAAGFLLTATADSRRDTQPAIAVTSPTTTEPTEPTSPVVSVEQVAPAEPSSSSDEPRPDEPKTDEPVSSTEAPAVPTTTATDSGSTPDGTGTDDRPEPTGSGFELLAAEAVPASLQQGEYVSATASAIVFLEAERHVVKAPITLSGFQQGRPSTELDRIPTTIEAGTTVCVWFVHTDLGGPGTVQTTIDFGRPILGLAILREEELVATADFALEGRVYFYDGPGETDTMTVNGSVLDVEFQVATGGKDQLRVFTGC